MQRASRRFEQKIETITKIQYKHHRKQQPLPTPPNTLELPAITNSFPTPSKLPNSNLPQPNTANSTSKRKLKHELDLIINQTLSQFKNQKVNRIIFASPLSRYRRTQYRASEHKTIDSCSFPRQNPASDNERERRKREFETFLKNSQDKRNGQDKRNNQEKGKLRSQAYSEDVDARKSTCGIIAETYLTAPDHNQQPLMAGRRKRASRERRTERLGSFSPWKDEQQDEDLINWYK